MLESSRIVEKGHSKLPPEEIDALLSKDGIPAEDLPHGKYKYFHKIEADDEEVAACIRGSNRGNKLYPPGGYLQWHTDSDNPGIRVYFTFDTQPGSFFRYFKNNEIVTLMDEVGWNIRVFYITQERLFWHCVYAAATRYTFGFNCPEIPAGFEQFLIG
jgi:hypothetical protein